MDFGDFANHQQNKRNAEAARQQSEMQRKEISKLRKEQKKTNDFLQSQEEEKQLQSKLFQLNSDLEFKYSPLLTESNTESTIELAREFLANFSHYQLITSQEKYTDLEYKNLASEARRKVELILDKAQTIKLIQVIKEVTSDYELISTAPHEELAHQLVKKYYAAHPEILDGHQLISPDHKELYEQANQTIKLIRQNEWFKWASDQLKAERKMMLESQQAFRKKQKELDAKIAEKEKQTINRWAAFVFSGLSLIIFAANGEELSFWVFGTGACAVICLIRSLIHLDD